MALGGLLLSSTHEPLLEGIGVHDDSESGCAVGDLILVLAPEHVLPGVLDLEPVDEVQL